MKLQPIPMDQGEKKKLIKTCVLNKELGPIFVRLMLEGEDGVK